MAVNALISTIGALTLGAAGAVLASNAVVRLVEDRSALAVDQVFLEESVPWASIETDGLSVILSGEAPDEAARFRALSVASTAVDASRLIDNFVIAQVDQTRAPDFSIELLKNDGGLSLIGLIPAEVDRDDLVRDIARTARGAEVSDLLEVADYPVPNGWEDATRFGLAAMQNLDRSKVSITAERVTIIAATDSQEEKARVEEILEGELPAGLELDLSITAPRPVISPYTLRFIIDAQGTAQFDACAAGTEQVRGQLVGAARSAGLTGDVDCVLGLGMPSPRWGRAGASAIAAVSEMGGGGITISDTDVTLESPAGFDEEKFNSIASDLENELPEVFALQAIYVPDPAANDATEQLEFLATLSPEGQVQLRGAVSSEFLKSSVESLALAKFGADRVYNATKVEAGLPDGWPLRVLTAVEALSEVNNGAVIVQGDVIQVRGNTGDTRSRSIISRILADKLDGEGTFKIDVDYKEELDPIASIPTPEECVAQIDAILAQTKITFEPGSSTVDDAGRTTIDRIAEVLKACVNVSVEIAGHTDSQGSEELNARISQSRADAVRTSLVTRRIPPERLTAVGYGEATPIADNGTEEGREANRRIEFTLSANTTDKAEATEAEPATDETGQE
ncbi:OmpA family protein [Nereida ignava]|uniref:OmpA family protein n=1 Tax=Nereida ignava TaxID=282199 RepID=UPI002FE3DA1F